MGWEGASMSIPSGGRVLRKPDTAFYSCCGRVSGLVMSAVSLSCQILVMFEAHWPMKAFSSSRPARLGWGRKSGGEGGDVALNSPLRTCLSLKHPLSCRAFKQLECMAKSRMSFWWILNVSSLIRNQEESHLKRTMGKSWVSWQYLL